MEPLQNLKTQVQDMIGGLEFPIKRTVVAQNVRCTEDEDLQQVASDIIHKALELPNIVIVRTEHKSGWESGAGLVKIEVETNGDLKEIIKNKKKLKQSKDEYLQNIFLHQSK